MVSDPVSALHQVEHDRLEHWWDSDYSWDGLARDKPWVGWCVTKRRGIARIGATLEAGSRQATLQDYWRRGPGSGRGKSPKSDEELDELMLLSGELIKTAYGDTWHVCHLPRQLRNGEETEKSDPRHKYWAVASDIIIKRLKAANGPIIDREHVNALCEKRAKLNGIVVKTVGFSPKSMNADFSYAEFNDYLDLSNIIFNSVNSFDGCVFRAGVSFHKAQFVLGVTFIKTVFRSVATFDEAKIYRCDFRGSLFSGSIKLNETYFSDYAGFSDVTFCDEVKFENVNFAKYTEFAGSNFLAPIYCSGAKFCKTNFSDARFNSLVQFDCTVAEELNFSNAHFCGRAAFGIRMDLPEEQCIRMFQGAVFFGIADFTGSGTRIAAAFDQCSFEKFILLDHIAEISGSRAKLFEKEFLRKIIPNTFAAIRSDLNEAKLDSGALGNALLRRFLFSRRDLIRAELIRNNRLAALEGGYRTLKNVMGKLNHVSEEQRFHRFQLQTRRMRSDVSVGEKIISNLYRILSDYGATPFKPIGWLFSNLLLFMGAYYWLSTESPKNFGAGISYDRLESAFIRSFSHTLPFSIYAFRESNNANELTINIISIIQGNISAILIFLCGVSIKKMFQIK